MTTRPGGRLGASPRVLCLIPARAGSKRIPDKNLATIGDAPLLRIAVERAIQAFGAAYVSTDSANYAELAVSWGATVPTLRPSALSSDTATTESVVVHALDEWDVEADTVVVTQPTSPFTTPEELVALARALDAVPPPATALIATMLEATAAYALDVTDQTNARFLLPELRVRRTQELPPLAKPTGGGYAASVDRLRSGGALLEEPVAVVLTGARGALDIDDPEDLERARSLAVS